MHQSYVSYHVPGNCSGRGDSRARRIVSGAVNLVEYLRVLTCSGRLFAFCLMYTLHILATRHEQPSEKASMGSE